MISLKMGVTFGTSLVMGEKLLQGPFLICAGNAIAGLTYYIPSKMQRIIVEFKDIA